MLRGIERKSIIKPFGESNSQVEMVNVPNDEAIYVRKIVRNMDSSLQLAMFDKECWALTRLEGCENVVRFIDCQRGYVHSRKSYEGWIIMEYIPGRTLREESTKSFSVPEKYRIIKQLLTAVEAIHNASIIHRDLNPNNVMITDQKLKIIDFGICKILGRISSETTRQFATNNYSAPEVQYHSENSSVQSDIYSLGATIYFLFTKKDPPLPLDFCSVIETTAGIDPLLKSILLKMVAFKPSDRYADVYEITRDVLPLYDRYLKSDEFYRIQLAPGLIEKLISLNLVQSTKSHNRIIIEDIGANFALTFAYVKDTDGQEVFVFDGHNYSFTCVYLADRRLLYARTVENIPDYMLDRHSQRYLEVSGTFIFSETTAFSVLQNDTFALINRIHDYSRNIASEKNIDWTFRSKYGFWKTYLKAMIFSVKQESPRFRYDSCSLKGDQFCFCLSEGQANPVDSFSVGDKIIFESSAGLSENERPQYVGLYVGYNASDRVFIVDRNGRKVKKRPPHTGEIAKDYTSDSIQYDRQLRALEEFERQETPSIGNIKGIFSGIIAPFFFSASTVSHFYNDRLDESQQLAVSKALAARDVFLIQGPPGTGKTSVIVEIVQQMLNYHQNVSSSYRRILIVSQAHAAVDKLLADLDRSIPGLSAIRIGDPDNLSPLANEKYGLSTKKKQWIEESVTKAIEMRKEVLSILGVTNEEFELFVSAIECLRLTNSASAERAQAKAVIDSFYDLYKLDPSAAEIEQLLIQDEWIKQISEKEDIIEYFVKDASIIIGTCTGFLGSNLRAYFESTAFECVIIDEAAKATLPELMLSVVHSKRVILVGDHYQLPPIFDEKRLVFDKTIDIQQLKDGGFKKIFDNIPEESHQFLSTQYRMHSTIGSMISHVFYDDTIQNGPNTLELKTDLFSGATIVWISTSSIETSIRYEQVCVLETLKRNSLRNSAEASIISEYLSFIDKALCGKDYSVGIIAAYRGQVELLRRDLAAIPLSNIHLDINNDIDTVDAFQGSQKDIIIYSTVRSSESSQIGFLREKPRLNVAFSRARCLLLIVGDIECLSKSSSDEFRMVIEFIRMNNANCQIVEYGRSVK